LSTRIYQTALQFSHANDRKKAEKDSGLGQYSQLLEDLRIRLDEGYTFTSEQKKNIRVQVQDTIYEASRTSFREPNRGVSKKLTENKQSMKLSGVFGNPSREKALFVLVKRICSSVRNSLRQDIRNSIEAAVNLPDFAYASATKFKRGGPGLNLPVGFTVHVALLV
ncbi:hypothetical protein FB45DRAFT_678943, partial [Roridomyces roridus]